jgi:hypothetical protein
MKSISAIVACHNAAPHLGHCLSSLRGFDEVLFLDDASTDESAAIAAAFPHVEILTPSPSECQGSAVSKARLVAATAGDAVCIIDADDYLLDNPRLGQRLERFERPGVQVVTAPVEVLGHGRQYPYGDLWDFALGQGSQPGGLMWRGETLRELIGQAEFLPECFEMQSLLRLCLWHLDRSWEGNASPDGRGVIEHIGGEPVAAYRVNWSPNQLGRKTQPTRAAIVDQIWGLLPSAQVTDRREFYYERSRQQLAELVQ